MSIATEIQRLQLAKEDIKSAIIEKGGTVEDDALIDTYGDAIRELSGTSTDTGVGSREWWLEFTSKKTTFNSFFANYDMFPLGSSGDYYTKTPEIITSNGKTFSNMFENCRGLIEIGGALDLTKATNVTGMFYLCPSLQEVRFVNRCIFLSISFTDCAKLSNESIQSIIDGLADLTGQATQTLTFHADVKAKLTEEQIATITSKNWSLAQEDIMKVETYEQRILTPEEGKYLYNESAKVISDKVYLGKEADASEWVEITSEEKEALEREWE